MPANLKLETIAKELGVSRPRVSQLKAAGMPVNTIAAARDWYMEHINANVRPGAAKQSASVTYDISKARARREHHEANLAEMREAEKAGQLVDKAGVVRAAQGASALMRQTLERLPVRLENALAAEQDPVKVRQMLSIAVEEALDEFAFECQKVADAGA